MCSLVAAFVIGGTGAAVAYSYAGQAVTYGTAGLDAATGELTPEEALRTGVSASVDFGAMGLRRWVPVLPTSLTKYWIMQRLQHHDATEGQVKGVAILLVPEQREVRRSVPSNSKERKRDSSQ